jgi:hypothetical protein
MLYFIGGRDFESCWLEIFFLVSTNQMSPQTLISDAYEFLLYNFSLHDKEKAEQMERLVGCSGPHYQLLGHAVGS